MNTEFYIYLAICIGVFAFVLKRYGVTLTLKYIRILVGIIFCGILIFSGWVKLQILVDTKPGMCTLFGGVPGISLHINPDGRIPKDPHKIRYCKLNTDGNFECPVCRFGEQ